jgi:hypothetical protein
LIAGSGQEVAETALAAATVRTIQGRSRAVLMEISLRMLNLRLSVTTVPTICSAAVRLSEGLGVMVRGAVVIEDVTTILRARDVFLKFFYALPSKGA